MRSLKSIFVVLLVTALGVSAWVLVQGGVARSNPPVDPPSRLSRQETFPASDIVLDPPSSDYQPVVDASAAVATAEQHEPTDQASRISPLLALFTNQAAVPVGADTDQPIGPPIWVRVPAWIVTVDGVCIPVFGGFVHTDNPTSLSSCAGTQAHLVINATTGEFLEEFTS